MGLFGLSKKEQERLKEEIVKKAVAEAQSKIDELVKRAKKDVSDSYAKFEQSVMDGKSSAVSQVKALEAKVESYKSAIDKTASEHLGMTREAEKKAAESNTYVKEARGLVDAAAKSARDASERADEVEAILNESKELTARIDAEIKKAVVDFSARAETIVSGKAEDLEKYLNDCLGTARDVLVNEFKAEYGKQIDALKADKRAFLDDYHKRLEVLDRKAGELASAEQRVYEVVKFMKDNLPHVVYVLGLSLSEQQMLRDLEHKYGGNVGHLRRDLEQKAVEVKGKKSLSLDELGAAQMPAVFEKLLKYQQEHRVNLSRVLYRIDNWNGKSA